MKTSIKQSSQAFTIIEVLIVLAIMGLTLSVAVTYISGGLNNANFTSATNNFKQQIQQMIIEASNGYYPPNNNSSCNANSSPSPTPVTLTMLPGGNTQGVNYGCIFLGKVTEFWSNRNPNQISVFTIVGNQHDSTGHSPTTITAAIPVLDPYSSLVQSLEYNLNVKSVTAQVSANGVTPVVTKSTAAFGLLAGDPEGNIASYSSGNLSSGGQSLSLYYDSASSLSNISTGELANDVDGVNNTYNTYLKYATNIKICVSGGNNQSALIQIGGSGSLTVSMKVWDTSKCS